MKEIYSILVADSNLALLEGLVSIINQEPAFEVVGTASSKSELYIKVSSPVHDLLILDIELTGLIGRGHPENLIGLTELSKIILLTDDCEHSLIKRIKTSGAMGCLKKSCDAAELIYAMNAVLEGNPYFSEFHHKMAHEQKYENRNEALVTAKESAIVYPK